MLHHPKFPNLPKSYFTGDSGDSVHHCGKPLFQVNHLARLQNHRWFLGLGCFRIRGIHGIHYPTDPTDRFDLTVFCFLSAFTMFVDIFFSRIAFIFILILIIAIIAGNAGNSPIDVFFTEVTEAHFFTKRNSKGRSMLAGC